MEVVSLSELRAATGNFSSEQRLGRGAFGDVYAGTLAGCAVAVKRLRLDGSQVREATTPSICTTHRHLGRRRVSHRAGCELLAQTPLHFASARCGCVAYLLEPSDSLSTPQALTTGRDASSTRGRRAHWITTLPAEAARSR